MKGEGAQWPDAGSRHPTLVLTTLRHPYLSLGLPGREAHHSCLPPCCPSFFSSLSMLEKFIWRTQRPGQTWRGCLSEQRRHWAIGSSSRTQRQRYVDRSYVRALQSQHQPERVWTVHTPWQPRHQTTENYYASLIRGPPEIIGILSIPLMSPIQPQVAESFKTVFPFGFSKVGTREPAPAIGHGGPRVQPFLVPKFIWLCFWAKQPTSSDFINRHSSAHPESRNPWLDLNQTV